MNRLDHTLLAPVHKCIADLGTMRVNFESLWSHKRSRPGRRCRVCEDSVVPSSKGVRGFGVTHFQTCCHQLHRHRASASEETTTRLSRKHTKRGSQREPAPRTTNTTAHRDRAHKMSRFRDLLGCNLHRKVCQPFILRTRDHTTWLRLRPDFPTAA